jgi:hypothetical protein
MTGMISNEGDHSANGKLETDTCVLFGKNLFWSPVTSILLTWLSDTESSHGIASHKFK